MRPGRACPLWSKAGLHVPRKRPRKRVTKSRPRPQLPTRANGQQLECFTIIDEFARKCLVNDVEGSIRSGRVVEVPLRLASDRGAPFHRRSDNNPGFVSKALLRWAKNEKLGIAMIDPGKPWQHGMVESFNGKFRYECLLMEWLRSRVEAKVVIEK